jgi:hypothetical protein
MANCRPNRLGLRREGRDILEGLIDRRADDLLGCRDALWTVRSQPILASNGFLLSFFALRKATINLLLRVCLRPHIKESAAKTALATTAKTAAALNSRVAVFDSAQNVGNFLVCVAGLFDD